MRKQITSLFLICIMLFTFEATALAGNQSGTISPNEFNQWTITEKILVLL